MCSYKFRKICVRPATLFFHRTPLVAASRGHIYLNKSAAERANAQSLQRLKFVRCHWWGSIHWWYGTSAGAPEDTRRKFLKTPFLKNTSGRLLLNITILVTMLQLKNFFHFDSLYYHERILLITSKYKNFYLSILYFLNFSIIVNVWLSFNSIFKC